MRKKINEILNEHILENIAFSNKEKYSKDKGVAIWYYPAPFDDIDRDLTEAEEAYCTKKLAQDVDACKRRIFVAIKRYEKTLKKN